jgi:hypothetical protein
MEGQFELPRGKFSLGKYRAGILAISIVLICVIPTFAMARDNRQAGSSEEGRGADVSSAARREAPFLAANEVAMKKMMEGMSAQPSGDVDRDFVAMMVPHHQGAIDMAVAELRYGRNERLRRLAQEIIVTQQQEIAAMHLAIGDPLLPSPASSNQHQSAPGH